MTLLLLSLAACFLVTDAEHVARIDADGDGAFAATYGGDDCDDTNANVHPGAPDTCDGLDQDCDGELDEDSVDRSAWFADNDGDGFGDPDVALEACAAPDGFVTDDRDCNDHDDDVYPSAAETCAATEDLNCDGQFGPDDHDGDGFPACEECDDGDAGVNPAAAEVCNGKDDDCEGTIDEGATDATTWYTDDDGDGYGAEEPGTPACDAPIGTVTPTGDCDDGDAGTNPGVDETCDDTVDRNCDDSVGGADGDGDGVQACDDCDDSAAAVFPGAGELCDNVDNDCDGDVDGTATDRSTWYVDTDADGYGDAINPTLACARPADFVADNTDCDDGDGAINPGAVEVCDDIDNDCSGDVDGDAVDRVSWYADEDGDGFGDAAAGELSCDAPTDYVGDATDCDDLDAAINPGAMEVCNELDDDCSGDVDGDAVDRLTWYGDSDGDAYGDASVSALSCDQPADYVADAADCDDSEASAYPGAAEYCDTVDNDCDGDVDEDDAVDVAMWYADVDGDGYGDASMVDTGCDALAGYVADATDCDDTDDTVNPGATEVCNNGIDDDCDGGAAGCVPASGSLAGADAQYTGEAAYDSAGYSVSSVGDVDGDGFGDLLIGAWANADGGGTYAGAAYLVLGSATPGDLDLGAADAQYTGEASNDMAGESVSTAGDVDGDGLGDLLVGAQCNDDGGSCAGAAYLVLGSSTPGDLDLGAADAQYTGKTADDRAGFSVSTAGDVDGDGFGDLLIGATYNDDGGTSAGAAYLVLGGATPGGLDLGVADAQYTGEAADDRAGFSVSTAGDVDGDGFGDLLIGATYNDDGGVSAGAAYLVLGSGTPGGLDLGVADAQYTGESAGDYAGFSVSTAGDVNGDGLGDLLIGAPGNDDGGASAGAAYLVLGSATPVSLDVGAADAQYTGEAADNAGQSVSTAGDVDVDGFGDLLVGAQVNNYGGAAAGAAYLVLGSTTPGDLDLGAADAQYTGEAADNRAGRSVSTAGDVDGDGFDDLLIGAFGNADGGYYAGAAYLILGSGL